MRKFSTLLFIVLTANFSAQWSDDPAVPLALSQSVGTERYLKATEDGAGGWYVFWRDTPDLEGGISLFGQHLDADGNSQWTENGKTILHYSTTGTVSMYDMSMLSNGNILIVYGTHIGGVIADSLYAILIDPSGDQLWPEAVLLAQSGFPMLYIDDPQIQPSGTGAIVAYRPRFAGAVGDRTHIDRIEANGTLLHGVNGVDLGTPAYGPYGMVSDAADGVFIHWRDSNGSGTHMGVMRLNAQGLPMWPLVIDPVAGSSGLTYQYRAVQDGSGGLVIAYEEGNPSAIKILRLDQNGNQLFSPAVKTVGQFASDQDSPRLLLHDNSYFVAWEDTRPPANNRDLYIQRLDMSGNPIWAAEGIVAIGGQTYIPHTDIVAADNGSVIVAQLMSVDGFLAQKISNTGNPIWTNTTQLCTDAVAPFYEEYELHADGESGAVSFWYNFETDNLYAARVQANGALAGAGCAEDITGNGIIDVQDFLAFNSAFESSCSGCPADINADGVVDVLDFLQMNSKFGQGCH